MNTAPQELLKEYVQQNHVAEKGPGIRHGLEELLQKVNGQVSAASVNDGAGGTQFHHATGLVGLIHGVGFRIGAVQEGMLHITGNLFQAAGNLPIQFRSGVGLRPGGDQAGQIVFVAIDVIFKENVLPKRRFVSVFYGPQRHDRSLGAGAERAGAASVGDAPGLGLRQLRRQGGADGLFSHYGQEALAQRQDLRVGQLVNVHIVLLLKRRAYNAHDLIIGPDFPADLPAVALASRLTGIAFNGCHAGCQHRFDNARVVRVRAAGEVVDYHVPGAEALGHPLAGPLRGVHQRPAGGGFDR